MPKKSKTIAQTEVRAYRINDAVKAFGIGRTTLYEMMKTGELKTVKVGGRRLIPAESLESLIR